MRFLQDGPSIPDDLLIARDRGDVIFFCGAGVSRAKAGLDDFGSLARAVIENLGAARESPARKLLDKALELGSMAGVGGLLATDRVFGLLEREFEVADVRKAVARALKPKPDCDLSAHRTILDLATTAAGITRLVTTNFDRLFEDCDARLSSSGPPRLPDPRSDRDFRGIVHLHGRVDPEYEEPLDDEFVVSSADFGRAYLAEGWATQFIQSLLARFQIVFIGYTADDPPVQYLLEALNLKPGSRARLYAFQAGGGDDAAALWQHRGVQAIQFDSSHGYNLLWDTLDAWAERARDIDGWYRSLLTVAASPAQLTPHVRGQIAHLVSTRDGAHRIATADHPIGGQWLMTFDPEHRYGRRQLSDRYDEDSPNIDPFAQLSIDDDVTPEPPPSENSFEVPKVPNDAWNPLIPTRRDAEEAADLGSAPLRGAPSDHAGPLSPRLNSIGIWIQRVSHQPVTLWWASQQGGLHPTIRQSIAAWIRQDPSRFPDRVRVGWSWLFAAWADVRDNADMVLYDVEAKAQREGWSERLVREYVASFRPQIKVQSSVGANHPLTWNSDELPDHFLHIDVDYPHPYTDLIVPDEFVAYEVGLFRGDLELARSLELEVTGSEQLHLESTRAPDGEPGRPEDSYGVAGPVLRFQSLMLRLAAVDAVAARVEIGAWPRDDYIFARLRIWAAGSPLLGGAESAELILGLSSRAFWSSTHARDLLLALRDRWSDFSEEAQLRIEERLLSDQYPWPEDVRGGMERAAAHYRLDRLHWLAANGIAFHFDQQAEVARLRNLEPGWNEASGNAAADSNAPVAFDVQTDDDPAQILDTPISEVLRAARAQTSRDFFERVQREPFRGLAKRRPARALAVLSHAARHGEEADAQWRDYLRVESRPDDPARLIGAIATRLCRLPDDRLEAIAYPVSEWMKAIAPRLYSDAAPVLPQLWARVVSVIGRHPAARDASPDGWAGIALNAPVGRLVELIWIDPATKNLEANTGLPRASTARLESLLELPIPLTPQAVVMISVQLTWLFAIDPTWATRHIVCFAEQESEEARAFWEGIFWAGRYPNRDLYPLLKPGLIRLSRSVAAPKSGSTNNLSALLFAGWLGVKDPDEEFLDDEELRDVLIEADDDLRVQIARQVEHAAARVDGPWRDRVIPFLRNVWPRQRALRTPRMSAALADLALNAGDLMPAVVQTIIPFLVPITGSSVRGFWQMESERNPIRRYPTEALDLLWAILPEDAAHWPYRIDEVIRLLSEAPATSSDPRLSELRRRRER